MARSPGLHPFRAARIVEGIAQSHDAGRVEADHRFVQAGQGLAGIVGRQELAERAA